MWSIYRKLTRGLAAQGIWVPRNPGYTELGVERVWEAQSFNLNAAPSGFGKGMVWGKSDKFDTSTTTEQCRVFAGDRAEV